MGWQDYFEILLCAVCAVLIAINIQLIFRHELYKSYGTGCIFFFLTLTLVFRIVYLVDAVIVHEKGSPIFIAVFVLAPNFLMTMVSLSFYT